jgi:hypothetical protein
VRAFLLALVAGVAAGASSALQAGEFLEFSPVPSSVAYVLVLLVGISMGLLVKGVQEGLLTGILITVVGTVTLFLAVYLPNMEIVTTAPELILRSIWWGAMTVFFLTLIGIFVGRIFSGE